ncbi:(4Fe-4S)-binding protein [candidate division KSB1 bacterium]|nr:MAG: (4Fe-4S)-binding protein [candidate division KSB1 bacterium]HDI51189.1 (4Fe-4S)-binding protein [Bacteroidota bacterium]
MIISVASGKGGTGKTTIATNLALSLNGSVQFLDCDVEEPNSHIFLKPDLRENEIVGIPVPEVDASRCTYCGKCGEICQYSAIVVISKNVLTFPELCHGCGGCFLVCPEGAISEKDRQIGVVEKGEANKIAFVHGRLQIGAAISPPLIKAVKKHVDKAKTVIIDAPPGTSCPVIEAVKESDFCILVTEPTPFGLNDLRLAVEMVRILKIPFGVIINRADEGDEGVKEYCSRENIPILMEIKTERKIAEAYSRGIPIVEIMPEYRKHFQLLFARLEQQCKN